MSDEQIIQDIRSGNNSKALSKLYSHLPGIRRMIRNTGGSREQAEDIFQEALIIFCRKCNDQDFRLSSGIYPYLYSICRFLWKDEWKKLKRIPVEEMDGATGYEDIEEISGLIEEESKYRLAEKIIAELADRCRDLLLLFYKTRMKLKDIALKMGYASEQTAKNQKYKCLEQARNKYGELSKTLNH